MSNLPMFLKSVGVGVAVAAPVGPMSLLCMRRSLARGWRQGLMTGFAIAAGDGVYAGVAALGLAGVSAFMLAHQAPMHLAAGLLLLYLGLTAVWRRSSSVVAEPHEAASLPAIFFSSWLLTLTNPPTIVMFAASLPRLRRARGWIRRLPSSRWRGCSRARWPGGAWW